MHRLRSFVAFLGHAIRRARYRHAELWRMAAEMVDDHAASGHRFRWVAWEGDGPDAVLECPAESEVTYAVTLPAHARVVSWCALAATSGEGGGGSVTFEIDVQGDERSSARCTVVPPRPGGHRRWRLLSVRVAGAGPARITFRTRGAGPVAGDSLRALWGRPSIETPRPAGELVAVLRSSMAEAGLRGLWRAARPLTGDALYRQWIRVHEPGAQVLAGQRSAVFSATRRFSNGAEPRDILIDLDVEQPAENTPQ